MRIKFQLLIAGKNLFNVILKSKILVLQMHHVKCEPIS